MSTINKASKASKAATKGKGKDKAAKAQPKLAKAIKTIQDGFTALARSFVAVTAEQLALNTARTNSYTGTVELASKCKDAAEFAAQWDVFKDSISRNVGGIAVQLGCAENQKSKGAYNVPGGLRSAVSTVLAAMGFGISLRDKDGNLRSFSDIRKAKDEASKAAEQAKARKEMTPTQQAQARVLALLESLKGTVSAMTADEATAAAKILGNLIETAASKGHADKATKAAA